MAGFFHSELFISAPDPLMIKSIIIVSCSRIDISGVLCRFRAMLTVNHSQGGTSKQDI
ncbi:hypothetical protein MUCCIDRAFT_155172 [Mucor lusitanicus CBS 277.49]|uniref:Uncharacterized protein n=1 Tax=Mucor lusitanicus CBS 277.49 TaxID=747725 RepID=A0A162MVG5_MUCCL|nr:hypothetical protein MUCCIDRAFT_155172 [Mucor lusitanicus CBS 277.49]